MIELKAPAIRLPTLTLMIVSLLGSATLAAREHQDASKDAGGQSGGQAMQDPQSDMSSSQGSSGAQSASNEASTSGGTTAQGSGKSPAANLPDAYKASNWIGKSVRNANGDSLGTIEELVMDDTGRVQFAIMKADQPGSKGSQSLVAVPLGHFHYPVKSDEKLVLDVSSDKMQSAPSFHASNWPNMGQPTWSTLIIGYWVPKEGQAQQGSAAASEKSSGSGVDRQQQTAGRQGGSGSYAANRDMIYLPQEKERVFSQLDTNQDAAIEPDEAKANERVSQNFDRLDTYDNDRITRSEFAAFELEGDTGQTGASQSGTSSGDTQGRSTLRGDPR